ncbi:MAG: hypothetical protein QXE79_01050 [Candidatus Bathyarchaeia archaeon]
MKYPSMHPSGTFASLFSMYCKGLGFSYIVEISRRFPDVRAIGETEA